MNKILVLLTDKQSLFVFSIVSLQIITMIGGTVALIAMVLEYRTTALSALYGICLYACFACILAMVTSPIGVDGLAGLPILAVFIAGAYLLHKKLAEWRSFKKQQITPWN